MLLKMRNKKLNLEERLQIRSEIESILKEVGNEAQALFEKHEQGIEGIKTTIRNPIYEDDLMGNGNGDEYLPFPSFYQVRGADFLLKKKRILLADEMGVGKTAQAIIGKIALENKTGKKIRTLVVCPYDVRQTWEQRLREYVKSERQGKPLIVDSYNQKKISEIDDSDFVIVGYSALAFNNKSNGLRKKLKEKLKDFDYVITDEVQNAKNPSEKACISKNLKEITDTAEYFCSLSGTAIPNGRLKDIYVLISMLEKEHYPTPKDVARAYALRPDLIRNVLNAKSLRREAKEIFTLPHLKKKTVNVNLGAEQQKVYERILENDDLEGGRKLQFLRKALLSPALLNLGEKKGLRSTFSEEEMELLGGVESVKYKELDKIVENAVKSGEKILIFSPIFTTGVTKELEKRYAKYGSLRLDGTNRDEREAVRKRFQRDLESRVLVATDVVGEGISLTAASRVVFLDNPYVPGAKDQMISRVHRRGQKKDVTVYDLIVPETIDQGVVELLANKRKGIEYLLKGLPLTQRQKFILGDMYNLTKLSKQAVETPLGKFLYTPGQRVARYFSIMSGQGSKRILKAFERESRIDGTPDKIARDCAEGYLDLLKDRVPANTAELYKQIIKALESYQTLENKIDLASGPNVLAKVLGEEVTSIDLNKYNFKQEINRSKKNITAPIHELPIKNNCYDIAVCSLALDQTSNEFIGDANERENSLKEANRILKQSGYYVITLPKGCIEEHQKEQWNSAMEKFGFKVISELTGYASSKDNHFNAYIAVLQKNGIPLINNGSRNRNLALATDYAGHKKLYSQTKRAFYTDFNLNGKPLQGQLKKYLGQLRKK